MLRRRGKGSEQGNDGVDYKDFIAFNTIRNTTKILHDLFVVFYLR